ncbi:MAG: FGGY family carbohydrate kinase [Flavobacteriaceae bacterium]
MKKVIAVFDIGKTNKKFFLFDENYKKVYQKYIAIDEIQDEDGFPTEDLIKLQKWLKTSVDKILKTSEFDVRAINFSTYGASFVHLDAAGNVLTPLYNYLKPLPEKIAVTFNKEHDLKAVSLQTASPEAGMLNSGMQLYWLKQTKPELYKSIKYSLHFPQYLSFMLTGKPASEFTSIGCHTALWDYTKNTYHNWVVKEGLSSKFPDISPTTKSYTFDHGDKKIKIGTGIHDSSAALIPYLLSEKKPFVLISTGTWSITLNPFSANTLTEEDIQHNCLNYLTVQGKPVRATRFFLGKEYGLQVKKLSTLFNKSKAYHKSIKFDFELYQKLKQKSHRFFKFDEIRIDSHTEFLNQDLTTIFSSFKEAYHQLLMELVSIQVKTVHLAIGKSKIKKIYIDGGFVDNDIFIKLVALNFPELKVRTTKSPLGSALGAAMVISEKELGKNFLKSHYKMRKLKLPLE